MTSVDFHSHFSKNSLNNIVLNKKILDIKSGFVSRSATFSRGSMGKSGPRKIEIWKSRSENAYGLFKPQFITPSSLEPNIIAMILYFDHVENYREKGTTICIQATIHKHA